MPASVDKIRKMYGDAEGPLGFPMHSKVATDIEAILKNLDEDCRSLVELRGENGIIRVRATPEKFELVEGERADISLITTDSVDRDKEVVLPQGADWASFQKGGGPVTFAHKYNELPVGRAAWVKRVKTPMNGWLAKTIYKGVPDDWVGSWFPDAVYAFVKDGMKGKSIGFIPTKMGRPTEADVRADPRFAEVGYIIRNWVGLEYAVAPIQSNPDAVTVQVGKMRAKGLSVPQIILDEMGLVIPEGPAMKIPEDVPPVVPATPPALVAPVEPAEPAEPVAPDVPVELVAPVAPVAPVSDPAVEPENTDEPTDVDTGDPEEGKATKYACSCIKCNHKMSSKKHCKDIKCPKCGGEMRRVDRPGPGTRRVIAEEDSLSYRLPEQINDEMKKAAMSAVDTVANDLPSIAREQVEKMQGRV